MLLNSNPRSLNDEKYIGASEEFVPNVVAPTHNSDGYQYLKALGEDLSLEDSLLVDMDDLIVS